MQVCPRCNRVRIHPAMRMMRKMDGKNYEETWTKLFEPVVRPEWVAGSDGKRYSTQVCIAKLCPECEKKEKKNA